MPAPRNVSLFDAEGEARPLAKISEEVGAGNIVMDGDPDPLSHPDFPKIIAVFREAYVSVRTRAVTQPRLVGQLANMGVNELKLPVSGLKSPVKGGWKNLSAVVAAAHQNGVGIRLEVPVRAEDRAILKKATQQIAAFGVQVTLVPQGELTTEYLTIFANYLDQLWGAGIRTQARGFHRATTRALTELKPLFPEGLAEISVRTPVSSLFSNGFRLSANGMRSRALSGDPTVDRNLFLLAAGLGNPIQGQPVCAGGQPTSSLSQCPVCPEDAHCVGPTAEIPEVVAPKPWKGCKGKTALFHILVDDRLARLITIPALEREMVAAGAEVVAFETNKKNAEHLLRTTDLSSFAQVLVMEFTYLAPLLENKTVPADCRVVVFDFHLMLGLDQLPPMFEHSHISMDQLVIHSCFPRYSHLYFHAGVPLDQIHWRPHPMTVAPQPMVYRFRDRLQSFQAKYFGTKDQWHRGLLRIPKKDSTLILCGGGHIRDLQTLEEALQLLPRDFAGRFVIIGPNKPKMDHHVTVYYQFSLKLMDYVQAIGVSRFVVVPLRESPSKAAGISMMAVAMSKGTPCICSGTESAKDHLLNNGDSLLIEEQDPHALASAIVRLYTDEALKNSLEAGARHRGQDGSIRAWAHEILEGCPPRRNRDQGLWHSW